MSPGTGSRSQCLLQRFVKWSSPGLTLGDMYAVQRMENHAELPIRKWNAFLRRGRKNIMALNKFGEGEQQHFAIEGKKIYIQAPNYPLPSADTVQKAYKKGH